MPNIGRLRYLEAAAPSSDRQRGTLVLLLAFPLNARMWEGQLASVVFTVILSSFAVPGVPGGSVIAMVPVLAAVNLPIDGIGILLAVDTIPDMFRTTANVTGSLALAAVLRRQSAGAPRATAS